MIELDPSKLAAEVGGLLLQRGSGLPSLAWQDRRLPLARQTLNQLSEGALLDCDPPADEKMAAVVRAMLYLWNGWPDDCRMYAQGSPEKERHYLTGIVERQAGNYAAAKMAFVQVEQHPIHKTLADYAIAAVGSGMAPPLRRFQQILQLGEQWEPHAFVDLFAHARAGKLCQAGEKAVCSIQGMEFELLFRHCYEAAAGRTLTTTPPAAPPRPKKRAAKRTPGVADLVRCQTAMPHPALAEAPKPKPPAPGGTVAVLCPKCSATMRVSAAARGSIIACGRCEVRFLIPKVGGGREPVAPASPPVRHHSDAQPGM